MTLSFSRDRLKGFQLQYIQIESISLSKISNRHILQPVFTVFTQPPESNVLKRLAADNMKAFSHQKNCNLFAYSYMLLTTIYDSAINQNLLNTLKSLFYDESLDLTEIRNRPFPELLNVEMKKLVVQFIFQLQFTDHIKALHKALQKYPIVLHILVIFLKSLLVKFGLTQAGDHKAGIPTESAFEMLSEVMDINFRRFDNAYLFMESHCVIYEQASNYTLIGHYNQSKPASIASEPRESNEIVKNNATIEKQLVKMPSFDRKNQIFNFEGAVRQSLCQQYDAPTPFFNLNSEQRPDFKVDKSDTHMQLTPYSSVPELKFGFRVSEDNENEEKTSNQSFEDKLTMLKNEENGWKSPIYNNGIILDDTDNAFNLFETANKDAFIYKAPKERSNSKIRSKTQESNLNWACDCHLSKKQKNKLHSRLYEINVLSLYHQGQIQGEAMSVPTFDCMIISIKNVFSTQSSINGSQSFKIMNKAKRAQTLYDPHSYSISDIDKSFQSIEPNTPKTSLNKTISKLNSSYFLTSKIQSRIKIIQAKPAIKMPKIKFTYLNTKI